MTQSDTSGIEIIRLLFEFISNNNLYITIIILLFILKSPLSNLLNRLSNLIWKKGDSHLSISTYNNELESPRLANTLNSEAEMKPSETTVSPESLLNEEKKDVWFVTVHDLLSHDKISEAELTFEQHISTQTDTLQITSDKCFYFRIDRKSVV